MPYDFNILVVNQKEQTRIPWSTTIEVLNEIDDYSGKRYHSIWPYMTQTEGIWYSLIREEDDVIYASFCESNYEIDESDIDMPYWISDESVKYHLTPLIIKNEYLDECNKIIEYLIKQSPIGTIMLLARYQSTEREVVCGILTLSEFKTLLANEKILFNVCYIIREDTK